MERLVTYDLALLLVDPAKERFIVDSATLDHALAAAALMDAVHAGVVSVDLLAKETKRRLVPALPKAPENPVLALIHGKADQVKPKRLVFDLGGSTSMRRKERSVRDLALHHLEGIGIVTTRKAQQFGAPRAPRVKVVDKARRESVLSAVREALVGADAPDPHIAALAVLLRSVDADRKLFKDLDRKLLRRRVAAIVEGDWMRETLSEAVENAAAAATAAALEQPTPVAAAAVERHTDATPSRW